jgi:hypothetical protein
MADGGSWELDAGCWTLDAGAAYSATAGCRFVQAGRGPNPQHTNFPGYLHKEVPSPSSSCLPSTSQPTTYNLQLAACNSSSRLDFIIYLILSQDQISPSTAAPASLTRAPSAASTRRTRRESLLSSPTHRILDVFKTSSRRSSPETPQPQNWLSPTCLSITPASFLLAPVPHRTVLFLLCQSKRHRPSILDTTPAFLLFPRLIIDIFNSHYQQHRYHRHPGPPPSP